MSKRPRCTNFSLTEENTLVELAAKYANILECKKSDHDIWQDKNTTWKKIKDEFSALTGTSREIQNLKDKYENMKRKVKKMEAERKKEIFQTGGGKVNCTVAPSATHNVLLGIMGSLAVGMENKFDADKPGKPLVNIKQPSMITEDVEEEIVEINDEFIYYNDTVVDNDDDPSTTASDNPLSVAMADTNDEQQYTWAKWNPEKLKSNKSAELTTKKKIKATVGETVKKYASEKLEAINAQKVYFENEEKRSQEKHNANELRAQEKHEWEREHYKLMCEKLRLEIINLKQVIIGKIMLI